MNSHVTTHTASEDARNKDIQIYVNGEIVHRDQAKVSVYDSGFMLGDGIWEGLRLYHGKWAFLNEHMDRLFEASLAIDVDIGLDREGVINALENTRNGTVCTSTGDYCMNGITRQKVIDVCRTDGIPVFERNYSLVDTYGADEAFLTGTFGAQTPVAELDGRKIGSGDLGPVTTRIRELYKDLVAKDVE